VTGEGGSTGSGQIVGTGGVGTGGSGSGSGGNDRDCRNHGHRRDDGQRRVDGNGWVDGPRWVDRNRRLDGNGRIWKRGGGRLCDDCAMFDFPGSHCSSGRNGTTKSWRRCVVARPSPALVCPGPLHGGAPPDHAHGGKLLARRREPDRSAARRRSAGGGRVCDAFLARALVLVETVATFEPNVPSVRSQASR
jgi:hypothetical protein